MIRVKDFAKVEQSQLQDNTDRATDDHERFPKPPIDIEVISLSSNEDIPPVAVKKSAPRTTKRKTKRLIKGVPTPLARTPKLPSTYKCHKISEYFPATKKIDLPSIEEKKFAAKSNNDTMNNNDAEMREKNPAEMSDVQRYKSNLRQAKVVLRRLSIEKPVETVRKRKTQEDQLKLPEFIQYEPSGTSYFKTYEQSMRQKSNVAKVDDDDVRSPEKRIKSESNQNPSDDSRSIKLKNEIGVECDADTEAATSNSSIQNGIVNGESKSSSSGGSNLEKSRKNISKKKSTVTKSTTKSLLNTTTTKTATTKRKKIECPHYKIIEDTMLAVDAFRYGDIDGVEHYFLSHFHADHYIGLKKSFKHKLFVSKITGRLVVELIKVNEQYIQCLDINVPMIVDGVEVTALDANHCPGAVMFLFKLKTGKCILHTGDFRASADMEEYAEFWNNHIDTIYLDTTYLSSKYDFFTQSDSISLTLQFCREFVQSSASSSGKHLIIFGAYKVGKEKVWLRIAQDFNYKVWIDDERHKVMQCIQNDEISATLTRHAKDANVHVLPLGSISYQFIVEYVSQFGETFSKVLAIRPSGWEKKPPKANFANRISILGVQYSEHSSYNELERFVRFMRPKKVISTVPFSSQNMSRTPQVPDSWLNPKLEPKSQSYQRNIMDYMVKKPEVNGMAAIPVAEITTAQHANDAASTRSTYVKKKFTKLNPNLNVPQEICQDLIIVSDDSTNDDYML